MGGHIASAPWRFHMSHHTHSRDCNLTPLFTALVVEDDPAVSDIVSNALRQAGFAPSSLRQHQDILEEIKETRYNLAFINVKEGDPSGLELAATLKQRNQVGDCIIMAAGAAVQTVVRAVKIGAYDFLQKPFTPSDLKLIISQVRERWELKQRVRRAELQHAALIQNIPLLIFALTPSLDLAFINKTVEEMLGTAPQEAMQTPRWLVERIHPQDRAAVVAVLERSFQTGKPLSMECRLMHVRGMVVYGHIRTIPSLECDTYAGAIHRLDGIFVDLTDRIHLEQALVQSAKLKTLGVISAEVAHEVRNPLMSIAGFARRLEKKAPDTPEVGIILRESKRLESLLNRIRDYLKPVEVQPQEVAVNIILADTLHVLTPEMEERRVWCSMSLDENLPDAMADPHALTQVALDLMRNAMLATEPGSGFVLRSFATAGSVHVECRHRNDPNKPIDPDTVLLPFDEGGFNEGLPSSYRTMKSMDGTLHVSLESRSDTEGGGEEVRITITLPQANEESLLRGPTPSSMAEHLTSPAGGIPSDGFPNESSTPYCFEQASGVLSQSLFEDLLARSLRACLSQGAPLSLALLDFDHFQAFARQVGRATAAEAVQRVTNALTAALTSHPCALLARHGAHELAVILPYTGPADAIGMGERLRKAVASLNIPFDQADQSTLTVSVGVAASLPDAPRSLADLLAETGKALFQAKRTGRNTVCCAPPESG